MAENILQAAKQARQRNLIIILLFISAIIASSSIFLIAQNPSRLKPITPTKIYKLDDVPPEFTRARAIKFSPDQTKAAQLFSANVAIDNSQNNIDRIIHIYRLTDGHLLNSFNLSHSWIREIEFSPDGSLLAATDGTGIKIWSISDSALILDIELSQQEITYFQFSEDNSWLAAANNSELYLLDINKKILAHKFTSDSYTGRPFIFSPDGEVIITADREKKLMLWSTKSFELLSPLKVKLRNGQDVVYKSADKYFIATSINSYDDRNGSSIKFWHIKDDLLWQISRPFSADLDITISPDSRLVASESKDGVDIWRPDGHHISSLRIGRIEALRDGIRIKELLDNFQNYTEATAFSADGKLIATIAGFEYLHIWQTDNGRLLGTIRFTEGLPTSICFDESGRSLVLAHVNGHMSVWDVNALIGQ